MRVVLRVDASVTIGSGHVMRCLTLAHELRDRGARCYFFCRPDAGNLLEIIRNQGFDVLVLGGVQDSTSLNAQRSVQSRGAGASQNSAAFDWALDASQTIKSVGQERIDWLVVDHYGIDASWEKTVRPYCQRLMVIDDLANRPHDCDLLLDQNFYFDAAARYAGLVPENCVTLLGPSHVLLRREFVEARHALNVRDGGVRRLLIFFGGTDPTNQTGKALGALMNLNQAAIEADVVVGAANPHRAELEKKCSDRSNTRFHCQVNNMAELINRADLGIGAGGSAMWERCFLGLPTITVVFAENQVETTESIAALGAIEYLGHCRFLSVNDYAQAISRLIDAPERVKQISDAALQVVPSEQKRVADAMVLYSGQSR